LKAARPPSFNEADVSDEPPWISSRARLTTDEIAQLDKRHEARAETLQSLDDLVGGVVGALNSAGVMDNTYVFFTSDNGWHEGEHRIKMEKARPYEEDIHMPLLVRGPDPQPGSVPEVRPGSTTYKLALNTDYMPTFTDLACSPDPILCENLKSQNNWYVPDGRSLKPVLKENAANWRSAILLENHEGPDLLTNPAKHSCRDTGRDSKALKVPR